MKKPNIVLLFLLALACWTSCHKDKEIEVKEAVVVDDAVTVCDTSARFSWQVDFVGIYSTGVEVSRNENMTAPRRVEATKGEDRFVAVVDSLTAGTKYYYRIVVWNRFSNFEQEVKTFTTLETTQDTTSYAITVSWDSEKGMAEGDGRFAAGDTCTLTATANEGYVFVNWTENDVPVDTNAVYSFVVTSDRDLVANFSEEGAVLYTVTTKAEPEEGGTVTDGGTYVEGREVELEATANPGYTFIRWHDGSTDNPRTITVTADTTYTAYFEQNNYTITASAYPPEGGTVSVSGDGSFHYGDECRLTATANDGYRFVHWKKNGEVVWGEPSYPFQVTESAEYVAHFEVAAFDLEVSATPTVIPQGGSSQLEAVASGGNSGFTYSWDHSSSLSDATIYNPTASPTTTTTYTCAVTSGGHTESGSCTVTVVCRPTDLTANVQNGNNVHLTWTAAGPADFYKVYRNDVKIQEVQDAVCDDEGLTWGATYRYYVTAVYQDVESPASDTKQVTIDNSLTVTATAEPSVIPEDGSSTLTAHPDPEGDNYSYTWTPTTGLDYSNI